MLLLLLYCLKREYCEKALLQLNDKWYDDVIESPTQCLYEWMYGHWKGYKKNRNNKTRQQTRHQKWYFNWCNLSNKPRTKADSAICKGYLLLAPLSHRIMFFVIKMNICLLAPLFSCCWRVWRYCAFNHLSYLRQEN